MMENIRHKQEALYGGIADMPLPDIGQTIDRFNAGYMRKPHTATMHLLHDMHRLRTRSARRALPGVDMVA